MSEVSRNKSLYCSFDNKRLAMPQKSCDWKISKKENLFFVQMQLSEGGKHSLEWLQQRGKNDIRYHFLIKRGNYIDMGEFSYLKYKNINVAFA